MKVRDEINKYASEENKIILNWLFDRYHMQSEWNFLATCTFEGTYPNSKRIWAPKYEGVALYNYAHLKEASNVL